MAENTNKPTVVGRIFRILGFTFAGISLFAAGVAASDTTLGQKVNSMVKKGARKIGLSKAEDKGGESQSRSDEERNKDRQ